jgi:hypothetical protein
MGPDVFLWNIRYRVSNIFIVQTLVCLRRYFIGNFAYKTKVPLFLTHRVKAPDDSDIFMRGQYCFS